jgi:hypothetical protein
MIASSVPSVMMAQPPSRRTPVALPLSLLVEYFEASLECKVICLGLEPESVDAGEPVSVVAKQAIALLAERIVDILARRPL